MIDGDRGVVFKPQPDPFSPSFDSFMPLVHADYCNIVSANRPFGKAVSQSVYAYYNIMHLWARVFAILRHRKILSNAETSFLERFEHDSFPVSEPVNGYLRCIGNFEDTNGVEHIMSLSARPNRDGHFGRISVNTHNHYEAYPAPLIAITRIEKDFDFTEGRSQDPVWEISSLRPTEAKVRPEAQPAQPVTREDVPHGPPSEDPNRVETGLPPIGGDGRDVPESQTTETPEDVETEQTRDMPTANLLGWYRSERLSTSQMSALRLNRGSAGFMTEFHMQYCMGLMELVADQLRSLSNYKIASALHESANGTNGQEAYLHIKEGTNFCRERYYCDAISEVVCLGKIDVRIASTMRVFGLRIRKNNYDELRSWACYDFNQYRDVPESWNANRNKLFVDGLELQAYGKQHSVAADRGAYRIQLDIIKDIDIVQFFEKGIRGGICQVVSRYAKANNKYLSEYDSTKPSNYLLYVDVNNLYGYAMNLSLPYAEFEWTNEKLNVLDLKKKTIQKPVTY